MIVWGGSAQFGVSDGGAYTLGLSVDDDGDGLSECEGDCHDADAQVWMVPSETLQLSFGDPQTLLWSPPSMPGGAALAYDLLRSVDPGSFGGVAMCVEADDASDTTALDPETPGSGRVHHYLVRAENACGAGTLGFDSSGSERAGRPCP